MPFVADAAPATAVCLDRHDLVVSKLVAHREKDLGFARALLRARLAQRSNGADVCLMSMVWWGTASPSAAAQAAGTATTTIPLMCAKSAGFAVCTGKPSGIRFHDLRHTGNTLAASTGASLSDLMARMGHASGEAALRYQHATRTQDVAIAASLSAMVEAARERRRAG